jgi:hypothetical protein
MKCRDMQPHPAIARVKERADQQAFWSRGVAMTWAQVVIPMPIKFYRRMAGLRGADLRA